MMEGKILGSKLKQYQMQSTRMVSIPESYYQKIDPARSVCLFRLIITSQFFETFC